MTAARRSFGDALTEPPIEPVSGVELDGEELPAFDYTASIDEILASWTRAA